MNIQITQIQCNACAAIIPAANQNGAVRLAGTMIDFCATCAQKDVAFLATTFQLPAPAKPAMQKVKLANGQTVMMPASAPLLPGASVVTG